LKNRQITEGINFFAVRVYFERREGGKRGDFYHETHELVPSVRTRKGERGGEGGE
jgi:hypothetical protein